MIVSDGLEKIVVGNKKIFLLDVSWHLYRSYYSFKWMSVDMKGYKRPTGHIYGILSTIQFIKEAFPDAVVILCRDGVPVDRINLYESMGKVYKEGRPELDFNFYNDVPVIVALSFKIPGVYDAYREDKESDDLMFALSKQVEGISDDKVYIYSGDDDLLQAITEQTSVIRKFSKEAFEEINNDYMLMDKAMIRKYHGVDSYHLPYYRVIIGDKSDKIEGIPRFPRDLAKRIAMSATSIDDLFNFNGRVTVSEMKYVNMLKVLEPKIRINWKLMKLHSDFQVPLIRRELKDGIYEKYVNLFQLNRYDAFVKRIGES